jgi:hypothetical protein
MEAITKYMGWAGKTEGEKPRKRMKKRERLSNTQVGPALYPFLDCLI